MRRSRGTSCPSRSPKSTAALPARSSRRADAEAQSDPSSAAKAAQRIATAEPETLTAPEQDVQLAKQSKLIEVKPQPASKEDVDFLSSAINLQSKTKLGPFDSEFGAGSEFSVGGDRDRGRGRDWENKYWDKKVRQWDRDWIEYDQFYRPIIFNPFRAPVRIVYALANATRILVIQPLARVIVDVAELAAYSFTAVVLGAANVVSDVANVAADVVNVAVGTILRRWLRAPCRGTVRAAASAVALRQRAGSGALLERDVSAVPGQPDRRRRRRRPVRRAESVARRSDACVGAVDHIADRRTAVRGPSHAAVPRIGRTARSAAARRLSDAVGV